MFFPIFFSYRIPSSPAMFCSMFCIWKQLSDNPSSSLLLTKQNLPFQVFFIGMGPSKDVYKGNSSVHKLYQFCISFLNVHLCSIQGRWWILLKIVHFPSSSFIKSIIVVRLVMRSISFHDTMAIKWLFLANVTDPTNHAHSMLGMWILSTKEPEWRRMPPTNASY